MKKKYFVSYIYKGGHGNCQVERVTPIRGHEDVAQMALAIEESSDVGKITILNWRRFEDDWDD